MTHANGQPTVRTDLRGPVIATVHGVSIFQYCRCHWCLAMRTQLAAGDIEPDRRGRPPG